MTMWVSDLSSDASTPIYGSGLSKICENDLPPAPLTLALVIGMSFHDIKKERHDAITYSLTFSSSATG